MGDEFLGENFPPINLLDMIIGVFPTLKNIHDVEGHCYGDFHLGNITYCEAEQYTLIDLAPTIASECTIPCTAHCELGKLAQAVKDAPEAQRNKKAKAEAAFSEGLAKAKET